VTRALAVTALAVATAGFALGRDPRAASPDSAPPLPTPTARVRTVKTESQLQDAVWAARSGSTIVIAPGTYRLSEPLVFNRPLKDIVIRGATNNRDDVVLVGRGMAASTDGGVPFGIWTGGGVDGITIANLTIRDVYYHPLIFNAGTQRPRVYNVRLVDAGQQFIKANPDGQGRGVDGGVVEYCILEYATAAKSDYTNGVDVHTGRDWVIRHNLFRRIRSTSGLAGPAVLMWNDSRNTIVEGNTFVDNHRDIHLGLIERTPDDHTGGIIRNNMIVRSPGAGGDVGIGVFDSPGTRVVHNTIWLGDAYPNAIEYRFPGTTGVRIANNLADAGVRAREGATAALAGNLWTATAELFVSPLRLDLHLAPSAYGVPRPVARDPDGGDDWDGDVRASDASTVPGADARPTRGIMAAR
jgi:hypothetical protein